MGVETEMVAEIESLRGGGASESEEEAFLQAMLQAAAGHVMFCMTSSRYGGESARIGG